MNTRAECSKIVNSSDRSDKDKEAAVAHYRSARKQDPNSAVELAAAVYWKKCVKNSHSIITDLFTGMFYTRTTCTECKTVSSAFEPFTSLSVETAPNGETTLEECLKDFSKEELLTDDNQYKCKQCDKKVDATKRMFIWEQPYVLIVHLKRFSYSNKSRRFNRATKTSSKVVFPMDNLNLEDNSSDIHKYSSSGNYSLKSVIDHQGSYGGGHYIAYCKNAVNDLWYRFNDSHITHIPNSDVEEEVITKDAYVLFYVQDEKIFI